MLCKNVQEALVFISLFLAEMVYQDEAKQKRSLIAAYNIFSYFDHIYYIKQITTDNSQQKKIKLATPRLLYDCTEMYSLFLKSS